MSYRCTDHPDTQAVLLITNLDTGDSVELCGPCVHPWALGIAAATDPDAVADAQGAGDERNPDDDDDDDADTPAPYLPTEGDPGEAGDGDTGEEGAWRLTDEGLTDAGDALPLGDQITADSAQTGATA